MLRTKASIVMLQLEEGLPASSENETRKKSERYRKGKKEEGRRKECRKRERGRREEGIQGSYLAFHGCFAMPRGCSIIFPATILLTIETLSLL